MNAQLYADILIRSRDTILEMLEDRGYNTTPYSKVRGTDLLALIPTNENPESLMIDVRHRTEPERRAIVHYMNRRIKPILPRLADSYLESLENVEKTELILLTIPSEDVGDTFDKAAYEAWTKHKLRLQFFKISSLVVNPSRHALQPKFEYVPHEQHKDLLKQYFCRSSLQFPLIKFHSDMMARYMGLVPGDIVKITRPSLSAGEYTLYRTCAP